MLQFQEKGKMQNAISYFLRKDNKIVPVEDNMVYLLDKDGMRIGAVAVTRDNTERYKAEQQLRASRDYFDNIFESSMDPIVVTDERGHLTRTNNAFLKLLDYNREEVIGRHMSERFLRGH